MPLQDGSRLPLQEEVAGETEVRSATAATIAFVASSVLRRKQIPDRNRKLCLPRSSRSD
jgi:hypothetical protein